MTLAFTEKDRKSIQALIERYPQRKAALGDVLYLAQERFGALSPEVEEMVAELMDLPPSYVHQVVTFYTMYLRRPVGKYLLTLCDNVSCMLAGSENILEHIKKRLGIGTGETTADEKVTLWTVECLGACEMAPVMIIGGKLYGNLTEKKVDEILDTLE